jgi:hypothetical protein
MSPENDFKRIIDETWDKVKNNREDKIKLFQKRLELWLEDQI